MSTLKLPYYPKVQVTVKRTPGGLQEISHPCLYDAPLPDKIILRVDLLKCLESIVGKECFIYRKFLYEMLAGYDNASELLAHLYRRHAALKTYVNDLYVYGEQTTGLYETCVIPLREKVTEYETELLEMLQSSGAKYLITTHGYVYVCYNLNVPVPEVVGGTRICS